jgi:hypothetical protein
MTGNYTNPGFSANVTIILWGKNTTGHNSFKKDQIETKQQYAPGNLITIIRLKFGWNPIINVWGSCTWKIYVCAKSSTFYNLISGDFHYQKINFFKKWL